MISAITAFAIALALVVAITPLVRRLAIDIGAVDAPGERRVHIKAIPRLGGIAIVLAFFAPLLALFGVETQVAQAFFAEPLRIVGLVVGGTIVCGLGIFDDIRGVRAWTKLWVEVAAGAVAYGCGFRIDALAIPLLGNLDLGIFALPVTALWVVAIINAINLIDGLDGLAGGVAFFACVTNFVVGAINHDALVMLLSASLGGSVLGFLLYNFNPASIFMGDSGSLFLGYVLATTSVLGSSVKSSTTVAIFVPLIALGLPIIDTLFAMVRRFLERKPIFSPDRGHIHHRLLEMGINHRRAVLILYGLSILFTAGSILLSLGRNWQVGAALCLLSVAVIGVVRSMGNFQISLRRWRRSEQVRTVSVDRLRIAIPEALQRIAASRDKSELESILAVFGTAADLQAIELGDTNASLIASFAWTPAGGPDTLLEGHQVLTATYPVLAAGEQASLRFAWATDETDIAPESDILLQLVADACNTRIARASEARLTPSKGHLRSV